LASLLVWAIIIFALAFGVFVIWSAAVGAGWEPTSRKKIRRMLEMSGAGPSDVVYDLGSGDGRIIVEAAKTYRARAVGVEADPLRVLISRLAVASQHLKGQVRVVWGNFFHVDLSEATIVTLFLSQGTNRRLESKLIAELRPGTRVVSHVWTFDGWTPALTDPDHDLSLYVIQGSPGDAANSGETPQRIK
jgi:precorrin-6B methylase 2